MELPKHERCLHPTAGNGNENPSGGVGSRNRLNIFSKVPSSSLPCLSPALPLPVAMQLAAHWVVGLGPVDWWYAGQGCLARSSGDYIAAQEPLASGSFSVRFCCCPHWKLKIKNISLFSQFIHCWSVPYNYLTHHVPVDLQKWAIFNTILMSPKSWLSQEDLDAGCEHSLVPVDS